MTQPTNMGGVQGERLIQPIERLERLDGKKAGLVFYKYYGALRLVFCR